MEKKLSNQIESCEKETLVSIVNDMACLSDKNIEYLKRLFSSTDPNKLTKRLLKEVSNIKSIPRYLDYKKTSEVAEKIDAIVGDVDKYLIESSPSNALIILKALIAIDQKLFEAFDDSYGELGTSYSMIFESLDKAFANSAESPESISKYIIETYLADEYGNRTDILQKIERSLKGKTANVFMKMIDEYNIEDDDDKTALKEKAADLTGDIDYFIKVLSKNGKPDDKDKIKISKKFIDAGRIEEAIDWLVVIDDGGSYSSHEKKDLLISAYEKSGQIDTLKSYLWRLFQESCSSCWYDRYIKYVSKKEQSDVRKNSIKQAIENQSLYASVNFLEHLKEYEVLNKLLLSRYSEVHGDDYGTYRGLSTKLAKKGYYLIAALLRRKLAESVIAKTQSKYYKYAASDYKLYNGFANHVSDWHAFETHDDFVARFNDEHKRKKAFWAIYEKS